MHNNIPQEVLAFKEFLVIDLPKKLSVLPPHFRMGNGASGSGQFSEAMLTAMLAQIADKEVFIIDLRQEPHGFIKGLPISWYPPKNNLNEGLSFKQIDKREKLLLANIKKQKTIEAQEITKKVKGTVSHGVWHTIKVLKVETEAELVSRYRLKYHRFYVLDHHFPSVEELDRFIGFVRSLPPKSWLHFHCRGGKGRSSTFMMLYDILQHAPSKSLSQILQQQKEIGSKDLFEIQPHLDKQWKLESRKARKQFLEKFYLYAKAQNGFAQTSWGTWLQMQ